MNWSDYKTQLVLALGAIVTSLLMGKTLRTLLLWPIATLIRKTGNKKADTLVEIAEADLGVADEVKKLESEDSNAN